MLGNQGLYAHAYGIYASFYCIFLKMYGGGYNAAYDLKITGYGQIGCLSEIEQKGMTYVHDFCY